MDNTARIKKVNMEIARIRDLNMENRVELKILWTFSSDSHGNLLGSHKTLPTPVMGVQHWGVILLEGGSVAI